MHSRIDGWLQTNPRLVAWPGDGLVWFLVGADGTVGPRFHLPDSALAVLHRFITPQSVAEVFDANDEATAAALEKCLTTDILVRVPESSDALDPGADTACWAGFRFVDHGRALTLPSAATRNHQLGGKRLVVYDHVLPPDWVVSVHRWLFQLAYRRVDVDTLETAHVRHWISEFKPVERYVRTIPVFRRIHELAVALTPDTAVTLRRIHAYSTVYGDLQMPHRDLEYGDGLTAIYYGNAEWHDTWLSETVFYDERGEPTLLVPPRPGRLALFDGSILHRGGSPSRECNEARYALVFKFSVP